MDAPQGTVPKTPPESDPRKENRIIREGNEISPGPKDSHATCPKDDGAVQTIETETPGLTGN